MLGGAEPLKMFEILQGSVLLLDALAAFPLQIDRRLIQLRLMIPSHPTDQILKLLDGARQPPQPLVHRRYRSMSRPSTASPSDHGTIGKPLVRVPEDDAGQQHP
jgi:hypothetical protein